MNWGNIQKKLEGIEVIWSCHASMGVHEIGCPCKEWTKKQLLDALISKKKFEQSGLAGTRLTK